MEETLTRILQTEIHRKIRCLMDHIIVILQSKIKTFSIENYGCIYQKSKNSQKTERHSNHGLAI